MPVSCGVSREHSSDLALLWLWCWPVATTPIQALAWELPYAKGVALKRQKTKKKKKKKEEEEESLKTRDKQTKVLFLEYANC